MDQTETARLLTPLRLSAGGRTQEGRRAYRVTFIRAGRVKQRNGHESNWIIPGETLRRAAALLGGKPVFIDHSGPVEYPSLRNLAGVTLRPAYEESGRVDGEIELYNSPTGRWVAELLDEIVQDQALGRPTPDVGLSVVFFGEHEGRGEGRLTRQISYVESVDLVFGPAAQGRIREALSRAETVKRLSTDLKRWAGNKLASNGAEKSIGGVHMEEQTKQQSNTMADDPSQKLDGLMEQMERLSGQVEYLQNALTSVAEGKAIKGMGVPPRDQQPRLHGMLSSLDQLERSYEALMGLPVSGDYYRASGIRELYTLLTGDRELRGVFNPEFAMLAYSADSAVKSSTFTEVTANVQNKMLVQAVEGLADYRWWEKVALVDDFNSLQPAKWIRVGDTSDLPTVTEGAEYTQLEWAEESSSASWEKRGGYLALTLEMIDKDDVAAWRQAPRVLARRAYISLSAEISALFTANSGTGPDLEDSVGDGYAFNATRGNLLTQPLDYTNWNLAVESMYKIPAIRPSGSSDRYTAIRPKYLLTPVDLEAQAISVVTSPLKPGTDYNDRVPVKRILPEENVVTVPHWTDAENWAALADPNERPFIGVGFRFGRVPELFAVTDPHTGLLFTHDVLPIKVRWFYAVGVIDWRGAIKSNV